MWPNDFSFNLTDLGLKLLAESTLVEKFLAPNNGAELLIVAASKSCPLLREATMR